jgi:toxin FitB
MTLLDTNVVYEIMRPNPNSKVVKWLDSQQPSQLALTSITVAEIDRGIKKLPNGRKRKKLEINFSKFIDLAFTDNIYFFDYDSARLYGDLANKRASKGLSVDSIDLMIATIAKNQNSSLATRNTKDFEGLGIQLINPWN